MKLCLNGIVKNEAAIIERFLKSVIPSIAAAVIVDTGSTDDTIRIIEQTLGEAGIPFRIFSRPFVNFMQARNEALLCARESDLEWDYLLLVDADMELVVEDPKCFDGLIGLSYDVTQKAGTLSYINRRLVSRLAAGGYLGVTHEYLAIPTAGCLTGVHFVDHACGSNRADKFQRDIDLLLADLRDHPDNDRSWFYLAQSYRDNGQPAQAAQAYKRRIELGGWAEEVWNAITNYASALKNCGDEGGFVLNNLKAYNFRPSRAEPLYDLAHHFRNQPGQQLTSLMFSEAGMAIPHSKDALFVNDFVYQTGLKEEFSICAFYSPAKRARGYVVTNELILDKKTPEGTRDLARRNMFFYLKSLGEMAPSFRPYKMEFVAPDGYVAMNPSIASRKGELFCIIRTVNYHLDEAGRYLIRSTGQECTSDAPINTRNFLCRVYPGNPSACSVVSEIFWERPGKPEFDLVTGLEDMRLFFGFNDKMYVSACARETNIWGRCQQIKARLMDVGEEPVTVGSWHIMVENDLHEKNWMVTPDEDYVYRLGRVVDNLGNTVSEKTPNVCVDRISGGSQLIHFMGGMLAVVHEACYNPSDGKRYYQHRFALFDNKANFSRLSLPFCLHEKQIEFVAGLCWHPDHKRLLLSYGIRDNEAWVASVDADEVMGMLL